MIEPQSRSDGDDSKDELINVLREVFLMPGDYKELEEEVHVRQDDYAEEQSFVTNLSGSGNIMSFNIDYGYLEAVLRGFRSGFLNSFHYRLLCMSDSTYDFVLVFGDSDFEGLLDLTSRPTTEMIVDRVWDKCVAEFDFIKNQAVGSLATFLNYIQYGYMIANVMFLISAVTNNYPLKKAISKCDPMGLFLSMEKIVTMGNDSDFGLRDLFRKVLVHSPVAPYFAQFLDEDDADPSLQKQFHKFGQDFNQHDRFVLKNTVYKFWLEDFYAFCMTLGGKTAEVMENLMSFEADSRAIRIMVDSFDTPLNDEPQRVSHRRELFPSFGSLYPDAINRFSLVTNRGELGKALEQHGGIMNELWQRAEEQRKEIEDILYEHEVALQKRAFAQSGHFGCFWAFVKLKEQEKRNLFWISECIINDFKDVINRWIKIY